MKLSELRKYIINEVAKKLNENYTEENVFYRNAIKYGKRLYKEWINKPIDDSILEQEFNNWQNKELVNTVKSLPDYKLYVNTINYINNLTETDIGKCVYIDEETDNYTSYINELFDNFVEEWNKYEDAYLSIHNFLKIRYEIIFSEIVNALTTNMENHDNWDSKSVVYRTEKALAYLQNNLLYDTLINILDEIEFEKYMEK